MLSAVPSSGTVNTMIRITGIGDHDRLEWLIRINGIRSNGQTEGQINRLKTLKRSMYGRAGTELLRARMLPLTA
jgi:hypothetical protein